jgi:histidinol-phosphate aminotransferase
MSRARIVEARQMIEAAAASAGLPMLKSQANFVYIQVPDAEKLRAGMADRNILIRGPYGKWAQWSRVSCGRIADVARYTAALPAALSA